MDLTLSLQIPYEISQAQRACLQIKHRNFIYYSAQDAAPSSLGNGFSPNPNVNKSGLQNIWSISWLHKFLILTETNIKTFPWILQVEPSLTWCKKWNELNLSI